ncbi:MAG: hypothetical protein AKCLJLPJ_02082 [Fimbriimonadales bacterium]|nr:hypothetical protein [Fimbriimonadales bacterium]
MRVFALLYGLVSYVVFLGAFLYAIAFVANYAVTLGGTVLVSKTIDGPGASAPFDVNSLLVNALLLGAFAIQHSVMARRWFKEWWTRIIPKAIERSTYVLISSLLLFLLYFQWRPMTDPVWTAPEGAARTVLYALYALGWFIVLTSTFLINHWDLFGLRQVAAYASGKEPGPLHFTKRGLYAVCRHPIMLGFIIAFWATPDMTIGHLVFSIATTAYIFVALQFEEKDLARQHPEYQDYRRTTSMVFPLPKRSR